MSKPTKWTASDAYQPSTPKEWFQEVPIELVYQWIKTGAWNKKAWARWLKENRFTQ